MPVEPCLWPVTYPDCEPGGTGPSCEPLASMEPELVDQFVELAVDYLRAWTKGAYGQCPVTIRPCQTKCHEGMSSYNGRGPVGGSGPGFAPTMINGSWYNIQCGTCGDKCGCGNTDSLSLPGPVSAIERVLIDGIELAPTSYRVDNWKWLVRTDGGRWPTCQDMGAPIEAPPPKTNWFTQPSVDPEWLTTPPTETQWIVPEGEWSYFPTLGLDLEQVPVMMWRAPEGSPVQIGALIQSENPGPATASVTFSNTSGVDFRLHVSNLPSGEEFLGEWVSANGWTTVTVQLELTQVHPVTGNYYAALTLESSEPLAVSDRWIYLLNTILVSGHVDGLQFFDGSTEEDSEWTYSWTGEPYNSTSVATSTMDPTGSFAITYLRGREVPLGGQVAAGLLACELAKDACNDSTCQLPRRVTSIDRQGVSVMFDDFSGLEAGKTGIYLVDSWVTTVLNAPRVSTVRSPDVSRVRGRFTNWP